MAADHITPLRALIYMAFLVVGLMAFLGIAGTITGVLNVTAAFATVGTVMTGLIGAIALRIANDDRDSDEKK